jgi:hypothetical protein
MSQTPDLYEILVEAQGARFGVVVQTNDPLGLRQKLYRVMKDNPELGTFSLHPSRLSPADQLFIIRKEAADDREEPPKAHPEPPRG